MVAVRVVDSPYSLGFGEKGFVQSKGKTKKYSRDKSGRVWYGWRKGTKFSKQPWLDHDTSLV